MSNLVVISPEHHQQLAIENLYLPNLGYDHGSAMISPVEILEAQRFYPLVFRKHQETGRFFLNALLGFTADENLHLDGEGNWLTEYVPLAVRKGPFLIAMLDNNEESEPESSPATGPEQKAVLSLNLDDPRVILDNTVGEHAGKGQKLFDNDGLATTYLEEINQILATLHETSNDIHSMVDTFSELDLIEPLRLEIMLNNGEQIKLDGAYTIAEEKLAALSGDDLARLNHQRLLSSAFYIAGSIHNVGWLVERKNQLVTEE